MAYKVILVDTSILIDFYRKTDKNKTVWVSLVKQGFQFAISSITKYEIYSGATENQLQFWNSILQEITVIPFDELTVDKAVEINAKLKLKRKQIDLADPFIASTAIAYALPFSTLNIKHFDRIDQLMIME